MLKKLIKKIITFIKSEDKIKLVIDKLKLRLIWLFISSYTVYYFNSIEHFFERIPERINDKEVIISLTSWEKRYPYLHVTLNYLLKQTFKVDRIVLWIPIQDKNILPKNILEYKEKGIDIRFTKDIGAYKKLIPTLELFPKAVIIVVDDDVRYPASLVARLYKSYTLNQKYIHANLCMILDRNKDNTFINFNNFKQVKSKKSIVGKDLLFNGVSGYLIPGIDSLYKDILNDKLFLKFAPTDDDLWFWAMAKLKNTPICKIKNNFSLTYYYIVNGTDGDGLYHDNYRILEKDTKSKVDYFLENIRAYYASKKLIL